ncbi:MAG: GIY-YIG nuclease family protein [Methylococcaceae bacterium]|nr:GIY-YIG nuclease family protein [Methylococcaceae bacterium]
MQQELKSGLRETRPFIRQAGIEQGHWFILGGQTVYVAKVGDAIKATNGENDARLRVIYANGTESNLLRRSLQRALHKDEAGRRISEPDPVETRIAEAAQHATYLLAEVEVVATYKLACISSVQLNLTIQDRFGHPVKPREWFLVPLPVIDEAVRRILDGSITGVVYDQSAVLLVGSG